MRGRIMYLDGMRKYDKESIAVYKEGRPVKGIVHYLVEELEGHEMVAFEFYENGEVKSMELGQDQRVIIKGRDYILKKRGRKA